MLAPARKKPELTGDAAITAAREETKFLLGKEQLPGLVAALAQRLSPHRYSGEGANRLPDAQHYVTTIYFDTPSRTHFTRVVADPEHNVKLRAREYYDLHASLAELATDPAQIVRYQPVVWFELKRREGTSSEKKRFRLRKQDVPDFFLATRPVCDLARPDAAADAAADSGELAPIVEYCAGLGEPLLASSVVNYRRLAFQDEHASLRVTLDRDLAFFAPPADLWSRRSALVRTACGRLCGREPSVVLEIKRRGELPAWLSQAVAAAGARPVAFSKFVHAEQAVHAG